MKEGNERLQCGGRVVPVKVEEVTLQAKADSIKETWQLAINEAREDATVVFTDGSKGENASATKNLRLGVALRPARPMRPGRTYFLQPAPSAPSASHP